MSAILQNNNTPVDSLTALMMVRKARRSRNKVVFLTASELLSYIVFHLEEEVLSLNPDLMLRFDLVKSYYENPALFPNDADFNSDDVLSVNT